MNGHRDSVSERQWAVPMPGSGTTRRSSLESELEDSREMSDTEFSNPIGEELRRASDGAGRLRGGRGTHSVFSTETIDIGPGSKSFGNLHSQHCPQSAEAVTRATSHVW